MSCPAFCVCKSWTLDIQWNVGQKTLIVYFLASFKPQYYLVIGDLEGHYREMILSNFSPAKPLQRLKYNDILFEPDRYYISKEIKGLSVPKKFQLLETDSEEI